jgi:hypothetical protein
MLTYTLIDIECLDLPHSSRLSHPPVLKDDPKSASIHASLGVRIKLYPATARDPSGLP